MDLPLICVLGLDFGQERYLARPRHLTKRVIEMHKAYSEPSLKWGETPAPPMPRTERQHPRDLRVDGISTQRSHRVSKASDFEGEEECEKFRKGLGSTGMSGWCLIGAAIAQPGP